MDPRVSQFRKAVAAVLQNRQREEIHSPELAPAAVLMAFYEKEGQILLSFTKRTDHVPYHKNQISFPGGAREKQDTSLLHTALRESAEEVGLDTSTVEMLGVLDDTPTIASKFVITPYVAFLNTPPRFHINSEEVAEVIEVPLDTLLDHRNAREETQVVDGKTHQVFFYDYAGHTIWGATARVLRRFLDLLYPALPDATTPSPPHRPSD
ncbi:MAG: CoA pyrophosphatase [Chloroflexota bacterium]